MITFMQVSAMKCWLMFLKDPTNDTFKWCIVAKVLVDMGYHIFRFHADSSYAKGVISKRLFRLLFHGVLDNIHQLSVAWLWIMIHVIVSEILRSWIYYPLVIYHSHGKSPLLIGKSSKNIYPYGSNHCLRRYLIPSIIPQTLPKKVLGSIGYKWTIFHGYVK